MEIIACLYTNGNNSVTRENWWCRRQKYRLLRRCPWKDERRWIFTWTMCTEAGCGEMLVGVEVCDILFWLLHFSHRIGNKISSEEQRWGGVLGVWESFRSIRECAGVGCPHSQAVCSVWISLMDLGSGGASFHAKCSNHIFVEDNRTGGWGFSPLDLVGPNFRSPLCMELQGLVGNAWRA